MGLTTDEERQQKLMLMHQASLCEFQRYQIWDGRQKAAVEIQNMLRGGRNTENLIKSTCFYLKISRVHEFCLNFSRVHMFCDDDCSKLVPELNHCR